MADFDVSLGGKVDELLDALRKAKAEGQITDKQFRASTAQITSAFKASAKEAARLGAAMKKDVGKDGKAAFDAVKNAAEGFGGKLGGSVAMVEKFGKAAAGIAGPLGPIAGVAVAGGLALGGLATAVAFSAEKMMAAADAAADFARANDDLIPPATLDGLLAFDDAVDTAKTTASATAAIFVGELAPGFEDVARLAVKAGLVIQDHMGLAVGAVKGLADGVLNQLVPGLGLISSLTGGAVTGTKLLTQAVEAADAATASYDDRVDDLIGRQHERQKALASVTVGEKAATEATKGHKEAVAEITEEQQAAIDASNAQFAAEIAWMAKLIEMDKTATETMASNAKWLADQEAAAAAASRAAWESFATNSFAAVQNFGDLAIQNAAENDKISATQAERRIAVAFALQKTAAIGQAAMTGADAYLKMVAFLAPFSGPAALPIAAGITGPLIASQIAVIAAQKPPTFATGGMVGDRVDGDHVTIAASRDEAVLTGRGVKAAGGPAGVAAMNAGRGSPTTIVVQLDRDVIARVLLDPANAKQLARAVAPHLRSRGM